MNAEQSDILLNFIEDAASGFDYFNFPLRKSAAQLKAEMEAMRTPITAEALTAAGWMSKTHIGNTVYFREGPELDYDILVWVNDDGTLESVRLWSDEADGAHELPAVQTMYDLGELVRLLGGAA